jgi:hypothetical protein
MALTRRGSGDMNAQFQLGQFTSLVVESPRYSKSRCGGSNVLPIKVMRARITTSNGVRRWSGVQTDHAEMMR